MGRRKSPKVMSDSTRGVVDLPAAAAAGKAEVRAEERGDMKAAARAGKAEARAQGRRDPRPSMNDRRGGNERSTNSRKIEAVANKPIYPLPVRVELRQPVSVMPLPDGGEVSTPYGRDPFRTNKWEAVVFEYDTVTWTSFWNNGASFDQAAPLVASKVLSMFEELVNVVNYNGRFTPNQILTSISDWPKFLENYTIAFSILWTYYSVAKAVNLNPSFRSFGAALTGAGQFERVGFDWERLQLVPMTPKMAPMLSKLFGVFKHDKEDIAYIANCNPSANPTTVTDWSLSSAITTLITTAETALTALETQTNEGGIIEEVLAMVYGPPDTLPDPVIHTEGTLFDMHYTRCVPFLDTTLATFRAIMPPGAVGGATPAINYPILQRSGEQEPLLFSYLRPEFVGASNVLAATQATSGLLNNRSSEQNFSRIYGNLTGGANNSVLTDAQTTALMGVYDAGSAPPTFFELEWWFLQAWSKTATTSVTDPRIYDRWDLFYFNTARAASVTMKLIDVIFLSDLKIRDMR